MDCYQLKWGGNGWFCQGDDHHEEHWCLVGFGGIEKIWVYEVALEDRLELNMLSSKLLWWKTALRCFSFPKPCQYCNMHRVFSYGGKHR